MIAVLYDVHGNLPALEAVLRDAEAAGADRFWLGGDYALFGAFQRETVERLRGLGAEVMIRGNVDRWAADPERAPDDDFLQAAIASSREALGELADELGRLPADAVRDGWHVVHAAPGDDMQGFLPRPREDEADLLAAARTQRVLVGHTHMPFRRASQGIDLVNPGSVGLPLDGDHRAAYLLLRDGEPEHRRVEYDWRQTVAAYGDEPWTEEIKGRLERARL